MAASSWNSIPCKITELLLDKTLVCGQSFRWRQLVSGEWVGVFADRVWKLKQTDTELLYQVIGQSDRQTEEQTARNDGKRFRKKGRQSQKNAGKITDRDTPSTDAGIVNGRQGVKLEPARFTVKLEPDLETSAKPLKLKVEPDLFLDNQASRTLLQTSSCQENTFKLDYNGSIIKTQAFPNPESIIRDYFQLDVNLENLYKTWSLADNNFQLISKQFPGIRILRQDPVECLFAFICSSNNNISRISSMVEKLAVNYGKELCEIDGQKYFSFPPVAALGAHGVEQKLRDLGFGYRARYIQGAAQFIAEQGGEQWLYNLRGRDYPEAKAELLKLTGVGPKVADCVSLFCLDKPGAIPVDTHVWQIAARDYLPKLNQAKSLTDRLYQEIGDHFRTLWGPYAGWAHSVLFTADLKQFKDDTEKIKSPKKNTKRSSTIENRKTAKKRK